MQSMLEKINETAEFLRKQAPEMPKIAIILGTEGDGLSQSVITASDFVTKIPMSHGVDSLNVAAASAIAFYELTRP